MSDYTPDWTDLRDRYALHTATHTGVTVGEARREAERGIAKIKAEALRQAAYVAGDECDETGGNDWFPSEWAGQVSGWLEHRADRIEGNE